MLFGGSRKEKVRQVVHTEILQNEQGGGNILALVQDHMFNYQVPSHREGLKLGELLGLCLYGTRYPRV